MSFSAPPITVVPGPPERTVSERVVWPLPRVRSILAVAITWAMFHLVLDRWLLVRGEFHPPVVTAADYGISTDMAGGVVRGVALVLLWWAGAGVAALLRRDGDPLAALRLSALGVAGWAFSNSTIDQWLINANPVVGPPRGGAYTPLLADYAALLPAIAGAALISVRWIRPFGAATPAPSGRRLLDALGLIGTPALPHGSPGAPGSPCQGENAAMRSAWLVAVPLGALIVTLLTGPISSHTRVLQVYFAVVVGLMLTLYFARKIVPNLNPAALWPLPWVLGVIGVLVAIFWPALRVPLEYKHLNSMAAWGLVRPLPVQFVSVGIATILWAVRPANGAAAPSDAAAAPRSE